MGHRRDRSDSALASMQAEVNKNVAWMNSFWAHFANIIGILLFRATCFAFMPKTVENPNALEWTVTNVVHGLIAFFALHWARGTPIWEDQGEHIEKTAWEQIDNGVPWTTTRKFLILMPVLLFGVSWWLARFNTTQLTVNMIVVLIQVIAKLPEMHGVRLWHVNEATVDRRD